MFVLNADFEVLRGDPALSEFSGGSGSMRQGRHCPDCGSLLFGSVREKVRVIRPGNFDQTDWFTIGAHIWTRSKQPWLRLSGGIPTFSQGFVREEVWPADSLERLTE